MIHTEDVEPWELRRAMAGYAAQGYPPRYGKHPDGSGFVIVIVVPDGAAIPDWHAPQPQRRRWPRFDWFRIGRGLALAVVAVALAYIAYNMFVGAALGMPQVPQAAPAIEMPWDAAGRQVGEAVDGIGRILTGLFTLLVLGLITFVAFKIRGAFHK